MDLPSNVLRTDFNGLIALAGDDTYLLFDTDGHPGRFRYLTEREARYETHYVAMTGATIAGVGGVKASPYDPRCRWLTHISIDENFYRHGHARRILTNIFADTAAEGAVLEPSLFGTLGWRYLANCMPKLHQSYPDLKIRWNCDRPQQLTDGRRAYHLKKDISTGRRIVCPD
jgi:hypothetical protein